MECSAGERTGGVVQASPFLTVHGVNVTLTGINRVATTTGIRSVVILLNTAHVVITAQISGSLESGKNQMKRVFGERTGDVVKSTPYLTVHPVSVTLTGINRVVVVSGMESVVTLLRFAPVFTVQTTGVFTENGESQMAPRNGDMTGSVVGTTPYLTVHLANVTLIASIRVVINQLFIKSVLVKRKFITVFVKAHNVLITELSGR